MKEISAICLTDSVFGRIKLKNAKRAFRYVRDNKSSVAKFDLVPFGEHVVCQLPFACQVPVYQFSFGGWLMEDGLTNQMKDILDSETSSTNVATIFLSIGVNDIR